MNGVAVRTHEGRRWEQWIVWVGRIISLAPVYIVLTSARWKLTENPWYVREFGRIGWQTPALPLLASLQLGAIVLYLIPQTAVLGAVLLTGYLGGAMASHVRIDSPLFSHTLFGLYLGLMVWGGLWLRDPALRNFIPFRRRLAS